MRHKQVSHCSLAILSIIQADLVVYGQFTFVLQFTRFKVDRRGFF